MDLSRRDFLGMTTAAVASGTVPGTGLAASVEDPLGCRKDFPVLDTWTYLNSPYIAPSPEPVAAAAVDFLRAKAIDPISLGSMLEEERILRQRFAELVNASADEIGILSTTSEGENVVTAAMNLQPGDNVVIDDLHYDTTFLLYDNLVKTAGIELRVVRNVDGAAPPGFFESLIDDRTRLVSVSWVSHQNGYRHDLRALAEIAHAHDAYLYVDAIQGIGAVSLDVRNTGVDFFTAGSYKWLLGGFGVAPFFVRKNRLDRIGMDRIGWRQLESEPSPGDYRFYEDARKFGYATPAFGAVYQLRAALDYLLKIGVGRIESHSTGLAGELNRELQSLGVSVLTPEDNASPIVAFEHGASPDAAAAAFEGANVKISLREQGSQVRAGVALFNNRGDVDRLLEVTETLRA